MNKLKNILFWSFGIIAIILSLAFSNSQQNELISKGGIITIDHSTNLYFITKPMVQEIIYDLYIDFDSIPVEEINIQLLEERLDNHPSIRKAEVYSTLDGSLCLNVFQKQPVARVQNLYSDFYIDELGDSMALSSNFYAKVPLINGDLNAENREKVHHFLIKFEKDAFYKNALSGIKIMDNGDWILYPKPGNHKVIFGKPENVEGKLKKLKVYYQYLEEDKQDIETIKSLNLKFKDQVICRKH